MPCGAESEVSEMLSKYRAGKNSLLKLAYIKLPKGKCVYCYICVHLGRGIITYVSKKYYCSLQKAQEMLDDLADSKGYDWEGEVSRLQQIAFNQKYKTFYFTGVKSSPEWLAAQG